MQNGFKLRPKHSKIFGDPNQQISESIGSINLSQFDSKVPSNKEFNRQQYIWIGPAHDHDTNQAYNRGPNLDHKTGYLDKYNYSDL